MAIEDNKQNQTQVQEPEPKDDHNTEPAPDTTIDDLKAEIEELKAEKIRLKKSIDQHCVTEKDLRKQLRSKMSVEEKREEQEAERQEYIDGLVRENTIMKHVSELTESGFSKEEATEIAEARFDSDFVRSEKLMKEHYDKLEAKRQEEYKKRLAELTKPESGNGNGTDYKAMFNNAVQSGDRIGQASAILAGNNFLKSE